MSFLPKCYTAVICLLFHKEAVDSTLYHVFLYCDVAIFFMLCESGFLTKYSSVSYIKRKKQVNCLAWGQESVRISVIARVRNSGSLFQSFLYVFRREDWFLSALAGCPRVDCISDSFCAAPKIIPVKASVYTQERLWQLDFRDIAKLRRAHL